MSVNASEKLLITDVLETSKNGTDIGSTYNVLKCEICNEELGKMYRTTPSQLDHLRGLFTLFVDKLSSYQVGSSIQNSQTVSLEDTMSFGQFREVHTKLQKIQQVVVSMDARIRNIENFLREEYDDQSDNTENTVQQKDMLPRQQESYAGDQDQTYPRKDGNIVYDPKLVSPRQNVPSFQPARHAFRALEEENGRESRTAEDPRRQSVEAGRESRTTEDQRRISGEGVRSNSTTGRSYIETLKRKLGSSSRSDNSSQQIKRSKF